jgi:hypothetical protein
MSERVQRAIASVEAIAARLDLSEADVAAFCHLSESSWRDTRRGVREPRPRTRANLERFAELNEEAQTRASLRVVE